jgi:hypothetical protein
MTKVSNRLKSEEKMQPRKTDFICFEHVSLCYARLKIVHNICLAVGVMSANEKSQNKRPNKKFSIAKRSAQKLLLGLMTLSKCILL